MEQRLPRLAWFDRLLTIPDVELTGSLAVRGRELGLHGIEVVGGQKDQLEILTDLDLDGPSTSGVAYVRYRALDASLALSRGDRRWGLVHARRRYDEAAAEYTASRGGG
jgi:hypothetical protein